jgi:hypothetical protein
MFLYNIIEYLLKNTWIQRTKQWNECFKYMILQVLTTLLVLWLECITIFNYYILFIVCNSCLLKRITEHPVSTPLMMSSDHMNS